MDNSSIFLTFAFKGNHIPQVLKLLTTIINKKIETRAGSYSSNCFKTTFENGDLEMVDNKIDSEDWRFEDHKGYETILYVAVSKGKMADRIEMAKQFELQFLPYGKIVNRNVIPDK